MKKCNKCEISKETSEFYRNSKGGYIGKCKECHKIDYQKSKEKTKKYYLDNKEKINERCREYNRENSEKIKEYKKEYYSKNKDSIKKYYQEYYLNNKKYYNNKEYFQEYYQNNKEYFKLFNKEYSKTRREKNPMYKLSMNIRNLIRSSLNKNGYSKKSKTFEILGCSFDDLLRHLNNNDYGFEYGENGLEIDHIIPISSAKNETEIINLNHYSNLQLLPSDYNRNIKRDKPFNTNEFNSWLNDNKFNIYHDK